MTYCSTYIGDLDHPEFKWEGGDWSGNIPPRLGPVFPPGPKHFHATFDAWVGQTGVINKQTDFDGWVARVTKPQLLEFIAFCYGEEVTEAVQTLIAFVNKLDETKEYGLVSECY
jgi:hypothetical protein